MQAQQQSEPAEDNCLQALQSGRLANLGKSAVNSGKPAQVPYLSRNFSFVGAGRTSHIVASPATFQQTKKADADSDHLQQDRAQA